MHSHTACKAAIKAGDVLDEPAIKKLVSDLLATKKRFICIHGRPTMWVIERNEIEKKLGTTVLLSRPEDVDLSHDQHGCLLCVLSENLNQHFDDNNALIAPISMLFRGPMSQRSLFLGSIYASGTFNYEVQYQDDQFVRITLELA